MSDLATVSVAVSPADKFREYLATRGMRLTRERETIVEEVFASHEHFDTDQLVSRLGNRTDGKRVSRATVYRTLDDMVMAGLLRKVARSHNREVYEHDYGYPQHEHLYCQRCHKMIEFQSQAVDDVIRDVCAENNFQASGHTFIIRGICAECNRARVTKRRLDLV